jgi:antitoxin component YwqK of YwqJK toxin-antitoxin module
MSRILKLHNIVPPLLMLLACLTSFATGSQINMTDTKGQRQGYWIILGSMIDDREYKPESKVEEGNYSDNRKQGLWKKYWPSGKVRSEINYTDGKPEGEYILYYENGKIEEHSHWYNSRNKGEFWRYYMNGNPQQYFLFAENGKRNGPQKYYHENGKLAMEVTIVNGQESGTMRRYSADGKLTEEKTFENGVLKQGASKKYKEEVPAPIVSKDPYDESVGKESKVTADKPNKAQLFKPNGFNTLYDRNGAVTQSGEFSNGRLYDGKWYRYNTDGILIRVEIYKGGKFIGLGVIGENEN